MLALSISAPGRTGASVFQNLISYHTTMGRIFETRKHTMFARWDRMAKQFTRIGKEIVIAVKAGGPDAANNPQLRRVIQNARAVNMPKDKVEAAIKRAAGKEAAAYEEILYEGYAPRGVAVLIEAATDNPTRTVSNLRNHFNKGGATSERPAALASLGVGSRRRVRMAFFTPGERSPTSLGSPVAAQERRRRPLSRLRSGPTVRMASTSPSVLLPLGKGCRQHVTTAVVN